jgi:isochorismate synthase
MSGTFAQVSDWKNLEGFVLSTFEKDTLYHFIPAKEEGKLYLSSKAESGQSEAEYHATALNFREELRARSLHKAVFSRVKEIPFAKNPQQLFFRLVDLYPDAFVYLLSSETFGTWVGATPEVLMRSADSKGFTMALAGTLPADDEGTWGRKELEEQEHVRNYIREKLAEAGVSQCKETARTEYVAGPVKHLVSNFCFELDADQLVDLAMILHPTPAVSGLPVDQAVKLIHEFEPHSRELYAGIIGWLGKEDSHLYVNLRCARILDERMQLYLGGGFTSDSDVEKEWQETENKARTLLNVIEDL